MIKQILLYHLVLSMLVKQRRHFLKFGDGAMPFKIAESLNSTKFLHRPQIVRRRRVQKHIAIFSLLRARKMDAALCNMKAEPRSGARYCPFAILRAWFAPDSACYSRFMPCSSSHGCRVLQAIDAFRKNYTFTACRFCGQMI